MKGKRKKSKKKTRKKKKQGKKENARIARPVGHEPVGGTQPSDEKQKRFHGRTCWKKKVQS